MDDFNRNRFWLAIGRWGAFTDEDNHTFLVWPRSYVKKAPIQLMPKFIDAKDLEEARRKAHYFIDKMFNDYTNVDKANGAYTPPPPDEAIGLDGLTIEGATPKKDTEGLLNLGDLV